MTTKADKETMTTTILTDKQVMHLWDTRVGEPCDKHPLTDADKLHYARAIEQAVLQSEQVQAWCEAEGVLRRNGFVKCDIPACNCGSWHARYGLPERMQEIKDALAEAGHPLSNDNGNLAINALSQLIKESQAWKRDAERYQLARRKVCIAGSQFHIINLAPRYVAPDAAIEFDSAIDALMEKQP